MIRIFVITSIFLSAVILSGCEKSFNSSKSQISFTTIQKGEQSGIDSRKQVLIKSKSEYESLMAEINQYMSPLPTYPEVDFEKNMVIAVFMGMQRTGGFETSVDRIYESGEKLNVVVKEISPGLNCMTTDVITYPYHIIKLSKINKPVSYIFEQEVKECN